MNNIVQITIILCILGCDKGPLYDEYYNVELAYESEVDKSYIIAKDGWTAKFGQLLSFEARDTLGFTFVGWKRPPTSYCDPDPIIDPDNFRINYVENPKDYFGNCNMGGLETVRIYPAYIRN